MTARIPCSSDANADGCVFETTTSALDAGLSIDDPRGELFLQTRRVDQRGFRVGERLAISARASEAVGIGGSLGGSAERLRIDRSGAPALSASRIEIRPGVNAVVAVGRRADLHGVAALECHGTSTPTSPGGVCDEGAPTGRIGLVVRAADGWALLANLGRYVRAPTLGELHGISPFVRGNARLESESGVTVDAGTRLDGSPSRDLELSADGFVFARQAASLISYQRTSLDTVAPFNVGTARVLGAEARAALDALRSVTAEIAVTVMDPRDITPDRTLVNDVLPFRARLVAAPRVEVRAEPSGAPLSLDRTALGVELLHRSSRFSDAAGTVVIPSQTTLDADAVLRFAEGAVTARFAVENVLDASIVDVIGFPLAGRSFHAGLEAWWR